MILFKDALIKRQLSTSRGKLPAVQTKLSQWPQAAGPATALHGRTRGAGQQQQQQTCLLLVSRKMGKAMGHIQFPLST